MIRVSNKKHSEQIQYIDRVVEVPAEKTVEYVDREVIKEMPGETIVIQKEANLDPVYNKFQEHETRLTRHDAEHQVNTKKSQMVAEELEMQRRALVAIKTQRDIDRSRRLLLIRKLRKERQHIEKQELKLKLAIGASFLLTILSFFIKL